jgi:manganese transport protein
MGTLTNRPVTTVAAFVVATLIVCLNVFLVVQTIAGA